MGSPPRVRGKGCESCDRPRSAGITPACAGKSSRPRVATARGRDHPRVCGEKAAALSQSCAGKGSPPRVRGKAGGLCAFVHDKGITPACAGKSIHGSDRGRETWDHPRVCGEKGGDRRHRCNAKGSPPRVRGKAFRPVAVRLSSGITPACAGKSCAIAKADGSMSDHPRVCGEK